MTRAARYAKIAMILHELRKVREIVGRMGPDAAVTPLDRAIEMAKEVLDDEDTERTH